MLARFERGDGTFSIESVSLAMALAHGRLVPTEFQSLERTFEDGVAGDGDGGTGGSDGDGDGDGPTPGDGGGQTTAGEGGPEAAGGEGGEGGSTSVAAPEAVPADWDRTRSDPFPFWILSGMTRNGVYRANEPVSVRIEVELPAGQRETVGPVSLVYVRQRTIDHPGDRSEVQFEVYFESDWALVRHGLHALGGPDTKLWYSFGTAPAE